MAHTKAVSEEPDRHYGPIKSKFQINLSECCSERLLHNKLFYSEPWMMGLFLFERTDPERGVSGYCDAFAASFSKQQCIAAWEAVGDIPCTQACLSNEKVRRELGDADQDNAMQNAMVALAHMILFLLEQVETTSPQMTCPKQSRYQFLSQD